jgi:uncharacterized protein with GYD domain
MFYYGERLVLGYNIVETLEEYDMAVSIDSPDDAVITMISILNEELLTHSRMLVQVQEHQVYAS